MKKDEILAKLASGELKVEEASKLLAEAETSQEAEILCGRIGSLVRRELG